MGSDTKLCREKKSQSLLRQDRGPGSSGTVAIAGAADEPRVCSSEGFSAEMDPRPGGELAAACEGDTRNERRRRRDEGHTPGGRDWDPE